MKNRRAFTMVELIVVMGIILVLITILVPVVSKVKAAAKGAENKQLLTTLSESITRYYADFNAYPGPLTNAQMETQGTTVFGVTSPNGTNYYITGSENLVLGLMGGLKNTGTAAAPNIQFDPAMVGQGPINLNPAQMKRYQPYVTSLPISEGKYADNASGPSGALDTNIPEFVDTFEGKMPILYLRARNGATGVIAATSSATAQYGLNRLEQWTDRQTGAIYRGRKGCRLFQIRSHDRKGRSALSRFEHGGCNGFDDAGSHRIRLSLRRLPLFH